MIKIQGIKESFGSLEVLKGIDLEISRGEVVSIVGPSGAGKTTLLQIIGTLSKADSGSVMIGGKNPFELSDRQLSEFRNKNIGFVYQFHHLLPEFSAVENVMIPALIAGLSEKAARQEAEKMISLVGLSARLGHKPSELSGGEQQRIAIARALVNKPDVVLADEPTGNLDSATKEDIHKLLFDLRGILGQTMIIITHDEHLASLCDRKLVMTDGRFVNE